MRQASKTQEPPFLCDSRSRLRLFSACSASCGCVLRPWTNYRLIFLCCHLSYHSRLCPKTCPDTHFAVVCACREHPLLFSIFSLFFPFKSNSCRRRNQRDGCSSFRVAAAIDFLRLVPYPPLPIFLGASSEQVSRLHRRLGRPVASPITTTPFLLIFLPFETRARPKRTKALASLLFFYQFSRVRPLTCCSLNAPP